MMGDNYIQTMKMLKRKDIDLDGVSDDLHDFSLSSPARKIRRLNAQLPPIIEEKEHEISHGVPSPPLAAEETLSDLPPSLDEERAIVLYKPVNTNPLIQPSPNVSVSLDSIDLVSGFKNQFLGTGRFDHMKLAHNETSDKCLAVVPWVPPSQISPPADRDMSQIEDSELMEADDNPEEASTMDIEDNGNLTLGQGRSSGFGEIRGSEGLHQWQQPYCMVPQPPENTSTPITWFR